MGQLTDRESFIHFINHSLDSIHVMEESITPSHLGRKKERKKGAKEGEGMAERGQNVGNNAIRKMLTL